MTLPIKDCVLAVLVILGSTMQERLAPSLLGSFAAPVELYARPLFSKPSRESQTIVEYTKNPDFDNTFFYIIADGFHHDRK